MIKVFQKNSEFLKLYLHYCLLRYYLTIEKEFFIFIKIQKDRKNQTNEAVFLSRK